MLKTASKLNQHKQLLKQTTRGVTSHHVYDNPSLRGQARKDILDSHATVRHHVGYLRLNREHRMNMLTPNFVKNIRRSLESLNMDEVVKVIYLTGHKGEHFSNGTDFRTILHHKKEGQMAKVAGYLEDLYGLQIQTSQLNKPLIGVAPGHSYNSGATFLQATGRPTVTLDSKLSFNEVSFGFVPHSGASFYLSRLPGEIGTFLALTGFPITGIDAREFGIADQLVHYSAAYEEEMAEILLAMDLPIPSLDLIGDRGRQNGQWLKDIADRATSEEAKFMADEFESTRKKKENIIHEEFEEPKDRKPSLTANADHKYKQLLDRYNKENFASEPGYFDHSSGVYQNYYNYIMGYVKSHSGHEYPHDPRTLLLKNATAINRCFYPSTLEEIFDNLKREETPFAKLCLEKMQSNSELSMKLALKLVRDARNLDFKGALTNEMNVALNKIQDREFDMGISEILLKPRQASGLKNPGFAQQVSADQVASYFSPNKWAKEVQLDVVEKALLPTRFYYERFSDQVRLWINETSTTQEEIRATFNQELKEALREQGIDLRDRALTIESARESLYLQEQAQRRQQLFEERLETVLKDDKLREGYFARTQDFLANIEQSPPQEFYKMVNQKIQGIFEKAYLEKLQMVYDRSVEAQNLEKRRMFIKFKKFLFQSRILTFGNEETQRLMNIVKNLPYKEPHLTEQWDGAKSYRQLQHPDMHQSFLSLFSSAIGKVSIAPASLAKQYISDPQTAENMTLYTFDKKVLEKLRADILADPRKYELALRAKKEKPVYGKGNNLGAKLKKHEEYDYWYRVINEGILPEDSLPYYKQLVAYRDFVKQVESRAFDTLRLTVQRLISDFDNHQEGVNEITSFSQNQRESKQAALRRLMAVVNEAAPAAEGLPSLSKSSASGEKVPQQYLTQSARSTKDIKRIVNNLLAQDPQISQIIPKEEGSSQMVRKFRDEIVQELYQLIEFVLINSATTGRSGSALPPKHLLQERLASLTNPLNTQQKNVTNLRVLDAFLNEQNSEALIKDAIRVAKPYFFRNVLVNRLQEESRKVFDGFAAESTQADVLHYYLMNTNYPGFRETSIMQRMQTFSEERDRQRYIEEIFPADSRRFALKRYIALMGSTENGQEIRTASDLERLAKTHYEGLHQMEKESREREQKIDAKIKEQREAAFKKHFKQADPNSEVDLHPMFNADIFDVGELEKIGVWSDRADDLMAYLEFNQLDVRNSLSNGDWLHIYSSAVRDHGLDMSAVMRYSLAPMPGSDEEQSALPVQERALTQMQNLFGGNKSLSWEDLADYTSFLARLHEAGAEATHEKGAEEAYQAVSDYVVRQLEIVDGEELLRSQSIYEMITHTKKNLNQIGNQNSSIREEIKDFAKLQQRIIKDKKLRESIIALAQQAPRDIADLITSVNKSSSNYINYQELERILLAKDYERLRQSGGVSAIIDKERIFSDLRKDQSSLQALLKNYLSTRLDVVSLAEARETVSQASTSSTFDEKLQNQVRLVLDFVQDSLKHVPHSRREHMTLGAYLHRHGYVQGTAASASENGTEQFLSDILRRKLEKVIGKSVDVNAADLIDWEAAGVRTNPGIHSQEEIRVKASLKGETGNIKGAYSPEATVEATFESQLGGRAAQELGESAMISYINPETGIAELREQPEYDLEVVLRDARKLTQLRPEGTYMKNFFENQIMELYSASEFDQAKVESTVRRYTDLRLKECLLSQEFAEKVRSHNGHLYLKTLKEQIADELSISQPSQASDFGASKLMEDDHMTFDAEGRYNLQDLSNLKKIGLESLVDDKASQTILDKLLADYFLNKRGQYVSSNELLEQLNKQFGPKYTQLPDTHPGKTNDKYQIDSNQYPFGSQANMAFALLKQQVGKEDSPMIDSVDVNAMLELDIATSQALQNGKNGLSPQLRNAKDFNQDIPEYFEMFDVRKPVSTYVEGKLDSLLNDIFEVRRKVEKTLSRNELLAYDKVLSSHLTKEALLPRLKQACNQDKNQLVQLKQSQQMHTEGKENAQLQIMKTSNNQREFNNSVQNEDALYKFLAYSGMLEKKRREDIDKTRKNNTMIYGLETFEEFYKKELQTDAKRPARPINPEDYQPRRGLVEASKAGEGFKTHAEKEADYFREYELYKENKKEQLERTQLFYVFEQFFAHSKTHPEPSNKAQEAIVEYFKDTENTFFFDKNKIQ